MAGASKKKTATTTSKSSSPGKQQRPPPIDKLIKPAVGIGLAMLAYQFFKGIHAEIPRVNMDDEMELRQLFFGEDFNSTSTQQNFAVLCHDASSKVPVSSVFQEASVDRSTPSVVQFRLLDCQNKLIASGKTVYERFQLNEKQRPVVFVSGAIGTPKQVPAKHLKTGSMLIKALKNLLEPKAEKIETTQDLRTKCLEKDRCGLLLKGSKVSPKYVKDAMAKLVVEHPKITFGAVDTSVLYLKNLEDLLFLQEFEPDVPRFVVFQKIGGSTDVKKSSERLKTSVVSLSGNNGGVSYGAMSNLVASVVNGQAELKKLSILPTIKTRTKKLVQEEKAKRERRENPQQPSKTATANDGSAEGRRLERERRRAEHRANNPDYKPKTPEEIAEIERQRRLRMEAEASKWNVAPEEEDAPEEGEPMGGEEDDVMEDGDDGDDDNDEDSEGGSNEEDDEDVMDLD